MVDILREAASIGIIESTTWLMGSMLGALSDGLSVQVQHTSLVPTTPFKVPRQVFRHALICGLIFSLLMMGIGIAHTSILPYWLVAILTSQEIHQPTPHIFIRITI